MTTNSDFSSLSVLVIDSDTYNATLTRGALQALKVRSITMADDAQAALGKLAAGSCDLAIVEMDFNDCVDGLEIVQMARTGGDMPNPYLPIIMTCSQPDAARVIAARDTGVNEFLRRPFSPADLRDRILAVLQRPRPFVKSKAYVGPDRRRSRKTDYQGPDRRSSRKPQVEKPSEPADSV